METVRVRRTKDVARVASIATACLPNDYFRTGEAYWIAWDNKVPIGFCIASKDGEEGRHELAGVTQFSRGKGVQVKLIAVREAWMRKEGCTHAVTYVAPDNGPSLVNLLKSGYRIVGTDDENFIHLRKQL